MPWAVLRQGLLLDRGCGKHGFCVLRDSHCLGKSRFLQPSTSDFGHLLIEKRWVSAALGCNVFDLSSRVLTLDRCGQQGLDHLFVLVESDQLSLFNWHKAVSLFDESSLSHS